MINVVLSRISTLQHLEPIVSKELCCLAVLRTSSTNHVSSILRPYALAEPPTPCFHDPCYHQLIPTFLSVATSNCLSKPIAHTSFRRFSPIHFVEVKIMLCKSYEGLYSLTLMTANAT
jgi:hypothetical protein